VGRTGAGKSTLMLAMFRLAEADGGKIVIDGVDVSRISLKKLRSSLAIIPQDPVLWSTTIRDNLDPFNTSDDTTIWQALDSVGLKVGCVFFACWYYCPLCGNFQGRSTYEYMFRSLWESNLWDSNL
jgi:ABC-type dipeptide/oligopeptide/nickel transport system ATPase subunit